MLEETFLYQEIHEQPEALARFLDGERAAVAQLAAAVRERKIDHVVIAARGTSDNAGRYAKYLLGAMNGLQVALATPSLFTLYARPPRFGNALVLGISQSGQSPDIVAPLTEARRQGVLTAALTNTPNSPLGEAADFVINLRAGAERSVAATKSYTNSLAALALLSSLLAEQEEMVAGLETLPAAVAQTLTLAGEVARAAERYRYMQHCVVIGRGFNYATAFELALKLKELTYTIVEPYSSADFQHGPMALIERGFPVIALAPEGKVAAEMTRFITQLNERGAEVICIGDVAGALAQARVAFRLPAAVVEWLSPLTAIVPGQLLAMYLAHTRGLAVDEPRGLRKVTETR